MKLRNIAILSPGEMGHSVGRYLRDGDFNVMTCTKGRSERTQKLSQKAGIQETGNLDELVQSTDLILAILVPDQAKNLAKKVAAAIHRPKVTPVYVDCNAISPETVCKIDRIVTGAGARFVDGGIIGGPPTDKQMPRLYVSGSYENLVLPLDRYGLSVKPLGGEIGRASGLKMCYASVTKGITALQAAALITSWTLGLNNELLEEFSESQAQRLKEMENLKSISTKSFRWIGEMLEIAATYRQAGVTSSFHEGAAEIFSLIAESSIGNEHSETLDLSHTLNETISIFAEQLERRQTENP